MLAHLLGAKDSKFILTSIIAFLQHPSRQSHPMQLSSDFLLGLLTGTIATFGGIIVAGYIIDRYFPEEKLSPEMKEEIVETNRVLGIAEKELLARAERIKSLERQLWELEDGNWE